MIRKAEINDKNAIVELFSELVAHHVEKEPDFFKLPERDFLKKRSPRRFQTKMRKYG